MRKDFSMSIAVLVAVVGFAVPLSALQTVPSVVPEISGASLSTGLALLGAGALWLRARRGVK